MTFWEMHFASGAGRGEAFQPVPSSIIVMVGGSVADTMGH